MNIKLMIKLIVGTEALLFMTLLFAYIYFAFNPGYSPGALHLLSVRSGAAATLLLLSSSFTLHRAEMDFRKERPRRLRLWLAATILLGALFLLIQGTEYSHLLRSGITLSSNLLGTSFFTLTGIHGLHVLTGLIGLAILFGLAFPGDFNYTGSVPLEAAGIYWHFIDIVWLFIFSMVYLLPHCLKT